MLLVVESIILTTHLLGSWQFKSRMRYTVHAFSMLRSPSLEGHITSVCSVPAQLIDGLWQVEVISYYQQLNILAACLYDLNLPSLFSLVSAGISVPAEARKTWKKLSLVTSFGVLSPTVILYCTCKTSGPVVHQPVWLLHVIVCIFFVWFEILDNFDFFCQDVFFSQLQESYLP